ncbi:hypothetical protein QZH41_013513, partial [Actinostola sp. cb2023]
MRPYREAPYRISLPSQVPVRVVHVNLFAQDVANEGFPVSNPYVFPPFGLVGPVKCLSSFGIPFTIVVQEYHPQSFWGPGLLNLLTKRQCSIGFGRRYGCSS